MARERWLYAGLAVFLLIVGLTTIANRPLFNPDEGRYAEIPREMLSGGDWIIPHLNGLAYIEKPPLQYWITALSYRLLGVSEFSARLYTALCALATIAWVGFLSARLWNPDAGWRAAALLGGMFLFLILGQMLTLDMSLTFWMTVSLGGFLLAQQARRPRGWMLLAWGAAALGVLSKGLVAAVIPAAVLLIYSICRRDWCPWGRLNAGWGLPLFFALAVPWHWLAARRLDDFLQFFFVHEHLARYLTPIAERVQPWWFFIAVFLVGSLPWTLPAMRVLAGGWRRGATPHQFDAAFFLWVWIVFICVFFSISDSKLVPYILPAMPSLAILIAVLPVARLQRDLRVTSWASATLGLALGAATLKWTSLVPASAAAPYWLALAKPLREIAALLLATGAFVLVACARDVMRAAMFLGVGWCLTGLLLLRAAALVAPLYSGSTLAEAVPSAERDAPVYSVRTYDQTLPFYLRRTVTLVEYRGELEFGLRKAPDAAIDAEQFVSLWNSQTRAYAVMDRGTFEHFKGRDLPMRIAGQTVSEVLVSRQ